jgi:D-alanyl-D-alanine dipeptidase
MPFDYAQRLAAVQARMRDAGTDWMLLSIGSDLPYFTGYEAPYTERLTALIVPIRGESKLLVPELEAPRIVEGPFEKIPWADSEDPFALAGRIITPNSTVAVGDQTWSSHLLALGDAAEVARWLGASLLTAPLRMVKDQEEVDALRRVGAQADRVAARIAAEIPFTGRTESAISRKVKDLLVEEGHDSGDFAIVGSGPNGASPHHEPGDRVVQPGESVVVDFGGSLDGYKSDTTRTFVTGEPSPKLQEVHEVVRLANAAGRARVEPGVPCEEIDRAARSVIRDAGYGEFFIHRTGHGIGLDVHEHPYMVEGNSAPLTTGMCFSVEPGVYLPGEFGVRIEDIVCCGEDGPLDLNNSPRDLIRVR